MPGRSRREVRSPGWGAVAGLVAAASGLAVAELVVASSRELRSPIVSVGDWVIDHVPAWMKDLAIEWFGRHDKSVLVVVVAVVLGALAAAVGALAFVRGSRAWLVIGAGAVALGAVGAAVVAAQPSTRWWEVAPVVVAAAVAGITLAGLRWLVARPSGTEHVDHGRRVLLAGVLGLAATSVVSASVGRGLQRRFSNAVDRARIRLPVPRRARPAPPDDPAVELPGLSTLFTANSRFYRVDTAIVVPTVDLDAWRLRITGMVTEELSYSYADLLDMPLVESDVTLACVSNEVGGPLVGTARWLGVPLASLLERAGVQSRADQVLGRSVDGFTAGFPVTAVDEREALVAVGMNGEVLSAAHGFPARLVVSGLYGYVSATKWLSSIELTRFDEVEGYWVPRGWARDAPVKTQSRIDRPRGGGIEVGPYVVAGVAWAPSRGITSVEVQIDGGAWREAELGPSVGDDVWRQWWIEWDATPGSHEIRCRATDGSGALQVEAPSDLAPDGATGWHVRRVTVS